MSDIVERLRDFAANAELWGDHGADLGLEAADEIERLRAENDEATEQIRLMTMTPEEVDAWLATLRPMEDR